MPKGKENNANFQAATPSGDLSGSSPRILDDKLPDRFDATLDRLKLVFGVKTDTDFARCMDIKQGSISGAKMKQAIPPSWITTVALAQGVSADWLLTGEGEMKRGQAAATPKVAAASPDVAPRVETNIYNDMELGADSPLLLALREELEKARTERAKERAEREAANAMIIQELQKRLAMMDQLQELRLENLKLRQERDTARAMCKEQYGAGAEEIRVLRTEVAQLRQELESCRVQPGLEDTG